MLNRYKYKLVKPLRAYSKELQGYFFNNEWISIVNGHITIREGYSWNGCTFAPDFKSTIDASCVHDAFYQFHFAPRKVADKVFYDLLKQNKFMLAKIYYISVRLFGGLFY